MGDEESSSDGVEIVVWATSESAARGGVEVGGRDDDQPQAVLRDQGVAKAVVPLTLEASVHAADREAIRLVEMGHRTVVLELAVFHDQVRLGPKAIDGEPGSSSAPPGVAQEPVKPMLALALLAERLVAQVENVELVTGFSSHTDDRRGRSCIRPTRNG